ncbi:MAG: alpha/beta hydrolase-fold protein [Oscillospiraceae bacterium]
MAKLQLTFESKALMQSMAVSCYLPNDKKPFTGIDGVVTLLHGIHGGNEDWFLYSNACRYARENNLALVCPSCGNSFYVDMAYGGAYFTFLTEELPQFLGEMLIVPKERCKNAICGLSMGGYGALLAAMSKPENYFAAASFSGAIAADLMLSQKGNPLVDGTFKPVFGEELILPKQYDLNFLAKETSRLPKEKQPKMLVTCGEQDNNGYLILMQNLSFEKAVKGLPLDIEFSRWAGEHNWKFWDRSFVLFIDRFFNNGYLETVKADWQ